tara:strand:+ start:4104 stop:4418 length:315 start_codon:yes stop_codon:yes gene_type:complete
MLRKPNSIPKGDTIIEDKAIEPYFLVKSQVGGYVIYKRVVRGVNNTPYLKTICYPGNFTQALKLVSEEILNDGDKKTYNSLQNYISEYKSIEERISSMKDLPIS